MHPIASSCPATAARLRPVPDRVSCHTHALTATGNTSRAGWEWPTCGIGSSLGGPAEHAGRTWSGTASPVVLWQQGNSPDRGPSPQSRTRGRTAVSRCCAARACKTSTRDPWRDRPVLAESGGQPRTRTPYKSTTYRSSLFSLVRRNPTQPAIRFTLCPRACVTVRLGSQQKLSRPARPEGRTCLRRPLLKARSRHAKSPTDARDTGRSCRRHVRRASARSGGRTC